MARQPEFDRQRSAGARRPRMRRGLSGVYGGARTFGFLSLLSLAVQPTTGVEFVWDDTGSGATWDGSVWGCASVGEGTLVHPTFLSRRHHDGPGYGECMGLVESMTTSAGG